MTVFTTDEVVTAVFNALGIEVPKRLTKFTLEVDYNGGPPTLTTTTLPSKPAALDGIPQTRKFRLEPIDETSAEVMLARMHDIDSRVVTKKCLKRRRFNRICEDVIVDAEDIQLPEDAGYLLTPPFVEACPDCYVGLAGQIEKCEKHRI